MAARLVRLTDTYAISSGAEKAQNTHHYLSPTGADLGAFCVELAPLIATRWAAQKVLHKTTLSYAACRADIIDINTGHVLSGQDVVLPVGRAGTDNFPATPAECSPVLTLRTPFSGQSDRGRMYFPPVANDRLDAEGYLAVTAQQLFVDTWAAYFDGVFAGTTDFDPGVYSRKNSSFTVLSAIDMGSVIDVQRRRRRSLVESRYRVSVA
jgi:hypothetical protein